MGGSVRNPQAPAAGTFEAALLTNNPIAFWRLSDAAGTLLLYDSVGYHAAASQGDAEQTDRGAHGGRFLSALCPKRSRTAAR